MSVLFRTKGKNWQSATKLSYSGEAHMQEMLYGSPELLPAQGAEDRARVFIREAGLPGSGSTDLLGVDQDGKIYIVECKLATNPEIRRKVIGQIVEYAAYLWGMSFEEFDQLFVRKSRSLEQLFTERAPEEWVYEDFRQEVARNLECGSFNLLIAVDEINEELEHIIAYLSRTDAGLQVQAIELKLFGRDETEILVPELHGEISQRRRQRQSILTAEEIFRQCEDAVRSRLRLLLEEWQRLGNVAEPATSGFVFRAQIGEEKRRVFWTPYSKYLGVELSALERLGAPMEVVDAYRQQISGLPGVDREKALRARAFRAPLADLADGDLSEFLRMSQDFVGKWRQSLPHEGRFSPKWRLCAPEPNRVSLDRPHGEGGQRRTMDEVCCHAPLFSILSRHRESGPQRNVR